MLMTPPDMVSQVEARQHRLERAAKIEVLDARGHPTPPDEVVRRLPAGAVIEWVPNQRFGVQYFGLFQRWSPDDPRWENVRSGRITEKDARDMVQMFPRECSTDQMAAYVEHRWGERNRPRNPRVEADRLVAQAQKLYEEAAAMNVDTVVDHSNERSARATTHELELRGGVGTANAQITVPSGPSVGSVASDGPKRLR